jgi:hypothetical protein
MDESPPNPIIMESGALACELCRLSAHLQGRPATRAAGGRPALGPGIPPLRAKPVARVAAVKHREN